MEQRNGSGKRKRTESLYILRLYITGASANSSRAVSNIKQFCEDHLKGQYELTIVDVYQQPQLTQTVDIIALPLLIRKMPLPEKRLIGDLSDTEKVIRHLGITNDEQ